MFFKMQIAPCPFTVYKNSSEDNKDQYFLNIWKQELFTSIKLWESSHNLLKQNVKLLVAKIYYQEKEKARLRESHRLRENS